jgi:hypothetical protein
MRFLIIASRRTGSSHLVNTLSGHADVFCHGNVFASNMMAVFWPKDDRASEDQVQLLKTELRSLRERDPEAFLKRVFELNHGRAHVGFKIFAGQNNQILKRLTDDPAIRKIVLFRKNVLASFSSQLAAKNSGTWGIRIGDDVPEIPKVAFEERKFLRYWEKYIRYYDRVIERLNGSHQNFFLMDYEELNEPLILASLINFIGADGNKPIQESEQRKQQAKLNPGDIVSRFSNPQVVREFLSRRNLRHWAVEGECRLSNLDFETGASDETAAQGCVAPIQDGYEVQQ